MLELGRQPLVVGRLEGGDLLVQRPGQLGFRVCSLLRPYLFGTPLGLFDQGGFGLIRFASRQVELLGEPVVLLGADPCQLGLERLGRLGLGGSSSLTHGLVTLLGGLGFGLGQLVAASLFGLGPDPLDLGGEVLFGFGPDPRELCFESLR